VDRKESLGRLLGGRGRGGVGRSLVLLHVLGDVLELLLLGLVRLESVDPGVVDCLMRLQNNPTHKAASESAQRFRGRAIAGEEREEKKGRNVQPAALLAKGRWHTRYQAKAQA
jgi:hypothetical protein